MFSFLMWYQQICFWFVSLHLQHRCHPFAMHFAGSVVLLGAYVAPFISNNQNAPSLPATFLDRIGRSAQKQPTIEAVARQAVCRPHVLLAQQGMLVWRQLPQGIKQNAIWSLKEKLNVLAFVDHNSKKKRINIASEPLKRTCSYLVQTLQRSYVRGSHKPTVRRTLVKITVSMGGAWHVVALFTDIWP